MDKTQVIFLLYLMLNTHNINTSTVLCPSCPPELDLMFVVDASGSVTQNHGEQTWLDVLNYMVGVAARLQIGRQAVQVGVITFSTYADIPIRLGAYPDTDSLAEAIRSLPPHAARLDTSLAAGLESLPLAFTDGYGGRSGVRRAAVVVSDGYATVDVDAVYENAGYAKAAGIAIMCLGVTPTSLSHSLEGIATGPEFVLHASDAHLGSMVTASMDMLVKLIDTPIYIGCYSDHSISATGDMALASVSIGSNAQCIDLCHQQHEQGYRYAATYSQMHCYCGNSYGEVVSEGCIIPCRDEGTEMCGGFKAISVYTVPLRRFEEAIKTTATAPLPLRPSSPSSPLAPPTTIPTAPLTTPTPTTPTQGPEGEASGTGSSGSVEGGQDQGDEAPPARDDTDQGQSDGGDDGQKNGHVMGSHNVTVNYGGHDTIVLIVACVCGVVVAGLVAAVVVYVIKYKIKKRTATNGTAGMTSSAAVPSGAMPPPVASWSAASPSVALAAGSSHGLPGSAGHENPGLSDSGSELSGKPADEGLPPYSV